jgi:putative peptidoglycan lipid II flippase
VDRRLASFLVEGSISSLWFAARLVQLPFAIIGIAISRAIAPHLSDKVALGDTYELKKAILIGYRYNLVLILPVIGIFCVLAHPFVRLVYERGAFSPHDTDMTARAFWAYTVGLLGLSLYSLGARVCSALGRNRIATYTAVFGAVANILLNYVLSATVLRHAGLALATSVAFSLNATFLLMWIHRYLVEKGDGFLVMELLRPLATVGMNSAAASLAAWSVFAWALPEAWSHGGNFLSIGGAFLLPFGAGCSAYAALTFLNPIEEMKPLIRRVRIIF